MVPMRVQEKQVTVDEFEAILQQPENDSRLLELIHGEVVEKVPTEEYGLIAANIVAFLWTYVRSTRSGRVTSETRHRTEGDAYNDRIPDVSYRAGSDPVVTQGAVMSMPDLAVEVRSPDDSLRKLREKARYYLENGSQLVWLVLPEMRLVEVYTTDEDRILTIDDTLTGGDLLPGFSLPVREIFADPAAHE
jgi:Uma2 family endonuclease